MEKRAKGLWELLTDALKAGGVRGMAANGLGSIGYAGVIDAANHNLDYSNMDSARWKDIAINAGISAGGISVARHGAVSIKNPIIKPMVIGTGLTAAASPPIKGAVFALADAIKSVPTAAKAMDKANDLKGKEVNAILEQTAQSKVDFENKQKSEGDKNWLERNKEALGVAAVLGLGALSIPAIINITRAADRVGDGRAIRTSMSLRKRPDDPSDLNIRLQTQEDIENELLEMEKRKKKNK